jgi:hypothetical protein
VTLFFYGVAGGGADRASTAQFLRELGQRLAWNLRVDEQQTRERLQFLLASDQTADDIVTFELDTADDQDIYGQLYDQFAGDVMLKAYRDAARALHIRDWQTIEFGASDVVDNYYREHPVDLPFIVFIREVICHGVDTPSVFCFDEGNEGPSKLNRMSGDKVQVLVEAWMTIAFGYTWPNVCLTYDPKRQHARIRLKLMADYESFPLWQSAPDSPANIDPETLPLSSETRELLKRWAATYDATLNRVDPVASGFESGQAEAEFDRQGMELRAKIQEELGDDYKLTYYSYTQHQEI